MSSMLSVDEARAAIFARLAPAGVETIALADAHLRVLARPIHARLTQPPADVSAMDGYAVRAADQGKLRVIGEAPAGRPFDGSVGNGEAVRLFTGSVVPHGADAVLLQEHAERANGVITALQPIRPGQHIRRQGQDFSAGEEVLARGRRLGARDIGLIAAANNPWVAVHRRPRVAILATGDEISLPGDPIGEGGIVGSNALALAALVRSAGADPVILPVAGDTLAELDTALRAASRMDLLLTTGGASVGDHDLIRPALERCGATLDFWKIAMRPGKPMMSGVLDGMPVLGLPGNPVSAFVCAILFLIPALHHLGGRASPGPARTVAKLGAPLRANDHRADHLRATLTRSADGSLVATAFARQDSALQRLLAEAGALILRPPHAPALPEGDQVAIIRLDQDGL